MGGNGLLFMMAGAILRSVKKNYKICNTCINSVLWHENEPHPLSLVVHLKNYAPDTLVEVSQNCFKAIMKCEITFRKMRSAFLSAKSINIVYCFVEGLLYVWKESDIPDCHKIIRNILDRFIRMRSKLYGLKRREEIADSFSKQSNHLTVKVMP